MAYVSIPPSLITSLEQAGASCILITARQNQAGPAGSTLRLLVNLGLRTHLQRHWVNGTCRQAGTLGGHHGQLHLLLGPATATCLIPSSKPQPSSAPSTEQHTHLKHMICLVCCSRPVLQLKDLDPGGTSHVALLLLPHLSALQR
jgi:hypothetical protein